MSKESAARFQLWMDNPCWTEVEAIIKEIDEDSIREEDRFPTANLNLAIIAECRGVRKGLNALLRRIKELREP